VTFTEPDTVRRQYATEENLATRISVWHPALDGRDPSTLALDAVTTATRPLAAPSVLDVGCGIGGFAARLTAALGHGSVLAVDTSERFVALTRERGVATELADVQELPYADGAFDVVTALWMLYHVPDLHRGLAEVRRVLRPGGTFVAVTNGDEHTADLRRAAGGDALRTCFSSENGEESLRRHFDDVRREDVPTRAMFADHTAAQAYLDTLPWDDRPAVASPDMPSGSATAPGTPSPWVLPWFDGPAEYAGHVTVFTCT
jgi:SAM-dependent methyltransferase